MAGSVRIDSQPMSARRYKHWGWGYEDQWPAIEQLREGAGALAERLDEIAIVVDEVEEPAPLQALTLRAPRVGVPRALAEIAAADDHARASHALGKSYVDVVRGFRGEFEHPPDFVVFPRGERDVQRVLEWCSGERVAAIPYGGGTSVVGGVSAEIPDSYNGAVSVDLRAMDRVLEVDQISRAARIQAGAAGPVLESGLGAHGMTLRHFPQSFEFSTLGGWIATRAAGHFATMRTHIEDFVESVRAITPAGGGASRRLPGSGPGGGPGRVLAGSEGTLGVLTEAWVRVQPRPLHRRSAGVRFPDLLAGAEGVRAISQAGLHPSNCRLLDAGEARVTMTGDNRSEIGRHALLVLGFESTDHPVDGAMTRALELCGEHGGSPAPGRDEAGADAVGSWREAFLGAPYMRDVLIAMGVVSETFETAITWERFPGFHERVLATAEEAVRETSGS